MGGHFIGKPVPESQSKNHRQQYNQGGNQQVPFILLNHDDTLESAFTVAHEAGHSIHSMYAAEHQPTMLQNYTIFVAEIASTFNEHNLLDYLMSSGTLSKEEQINLLAKSTFDNIKDKEQLIADIDSKIAQCQEIKNRIELC